MTMEMGSRGCFVAAVATLVLTALPAAAFDLDGTWSGKIACKGIFDGERQSVTLTPTLVINDGAALFLAADGSHYTGFPYPTPTKPEKGEIAIIRCDTSPHPTGAEFGGEFGRLKVTTKDSKGTGSISGTTYKVSTLIAPSLYTCKWSFKRTTTQRPTIDGCPQLPN